MPCVERGFVLWGFERVHTTDIVNSDLQLFELAGRVTVNSASFSTARVVLRIFDLVFTPSNPRLIPLATLIDCAYRRTVD